MFISSRMIELNMERKVAFDTIRAHPRYGPLVFEREPKTELRSTIDRMIERADCFLGLYSLTLGEPHPDLARRAPIEYEILKFLEVVNNREPSNPKVTVEQLVDDPHMLDVLLGYCSDRILGITREHGECEHNCRRHTNLADRLNVWFPADGRRRLETYRRPRELVRLVGRWLDEPEMTRLNEVTGDGAASQKLTISVHGPDRAGQLSLISALLAREAINVDRVAQSATPAAAGEFSLCLECSTPPGGRLDDHSLRGLADNLRACSWLVVPCDILKPSVLFKELKTSSTDAARHLEPFCSNDLRRLLKDHSSELLRETELAILLAAETNRILVGPYICDNVSPKVGSDRLTIIADNPELAVNLEDAATTARVNRIFLDTALRLKVRVAPRETLIVRVEPWSEIRRDRYYLEVRCADVPGMLEAILEEVLRFDRSINVDEVFQMQPSAQRDSRITMKLSRPGREQRPDRVSREMENLLSLLVGVVTTECRPWNSDRHPRSVDRRERLRCEFAQLPSSNQIPVTDARGPVPGLVAPAGL